MSPLLVTWTLFSTLLTASCAKHIIHERREVPLDHSRVRNRVPSDTILPVRIALHSNQHARQNGESWAQAVSDPDSAEFGKFWSEDEVIEAFKPADETLQAVNAWLSSNGILHHFHSENKQWLAFDITANDAEALLKTEYFERLLPDGRIEISCDSYSLPEELQEHVDFIKP